MTFSRIRFIFFAAVAVSIVHYTDNTVRFDSYTVPDPTPVFSWITAPVIAASWFLFTAFGVWGYRQLLAGDNSRAAIGLGIYSTSGLVGLGHFVDVPVSAMDAFQLTFIILDVVLGIALFVIAIRLASGVRPSGVPHTQPERAMASEGDA